MKRINNPRVRDYHDPTQKRIRELADALRDVGDDDGRGDANLDDIKELERLVTQLTKRASQSEQRSARMEVPHRRRWLETVSDAVRAKLWLAVVILFLGGLLIVGVSFLPSVEGFNKLLTYVLREAGTALLVTGAATGLIRIFIVRYYQRFEDTFIGFVRQDVTSALQEIRDGIEAQTKDFVTAAALLESMRQSGVTRSYESRSLASKDMAQDLMEPGVSEIRLIGISLNDFVRPGDQPELNAAWRSLETLIRGDRSLTDRGSGLDIKALIIDPYCLGAQLRSHGESRAPAAVAGRLHAEVLQTAEHLFELEKLARQLREKTLVSFEFRLYRLPPILFLCRTDNVSYVQQYYFWASRYAAVPIPVLRYRGRPERKWSDTLHGQMSDHFDWIWERGSISAREFLEGKAVGTDKGLLQSAVANVFTDPNEARERMLWLIQGAKKRVYMQGISLHSFFAHGPLLQAIAKLADRDNIEVRCLILDPQSEQAKYRAYREHLFGNPNRTFEEFCANNELYLESSLYRDTNHTIENFRLAISPRLKADDPRNPKFQMRVYDSAPACFLLIVDDSVLIEQYHYGKILPGRGDYPPDQVDYPVILGKDMPLVEYSHESLGLYETDTLRNSFELLKDHFRFVFERCARPLDLTSRPQ